MRRTCLQIGAIGLSAALCLSGLLFWKGHLFLDGQIYSRQAEQLDLRGQAVTLEHYLTLRDSLTECEIVWDVPIEGQYLPEDSRTVTVSVLDETTFQMLSYFPMLETVYVKDCQRYDLLTQLLQCPGLTVIYHVPLDGVDYAWDTDTIHLHALKEEEFPLFAYLPNLKTVHAEQCRNLEGIQKLQQEYPSLDIHYQVSLAGEQYPGDTCELRFDHVQLEELAQALPYLPNVTQVDMGNPMGDADILRTLLESYPDITFSWQRDVLGIPVTSEDTQVDISGISLASTDEIEEALAYFPGIQKVIACDCGIDNEQMAAFREKMRSQYKVVWSVQVGYLTIRTDEEWYMPGKFQQGVTNEQAYNLRYCEDMVCIDVGHKPLTDCEWAAFMPKLKYLIIAETSITDISPLAGHTNLIYLEMFITQVKDYSPLLTCTALEDLNLCYSHGDPEPIKQMTWLRRLWWAQSPIPVEEFQTYLPDTQLMFWEHSSTGNGWRTGQNYYDMRDFMGVPYMWG